MNVSYKDHTLTLSFMDEQPLIRSTSKGKRKKSHIKKKSWPISICEMNDEEYLEFLDKLTEFVLPQIEEE